MKNLFVLLLLLLPVFSFAQNRTGGPRTGRYAVVGLPHHRQSGAGDEAGSLWSGIPERFRPRKKKDYLVTVNTEYGPMRLLLYDQTPKHKENFIKLVSQKFYDGLLFHRVIQGFMVQGGDPKSRQAPVGESLGNGDVGYKIPAEINPALFHKKGALAAARDNNPEKASSGCQFYVVQGRVWSDDELQKQIDRGRARAPSRVFTDEQKQRYKTLGGSPHLDGNYTVFGEVIDGLAIVDSIAKQPRDPQDRPKQDIRMTMTGEWIKKKKISKQYKFRYL